MSLVSLSDSLDDRRRVFVACVDAVEIQDRQAAEPAHRDCELDVDHAVHRRTPDRDGKPEALSQREGDVDLIRIQRDATGDKRDLVETVRASRVSPDSYLEARLLPGNHSAGCEPTLIQGVFTPMAAGFSKLYEKQVIEQRAMPCRMSTYASIAE